MCTCPMGTLPLRACDVGLHWQCQSEANDARVIILEPSPHTYYLRVDPKQFFHNLGYAIHDMQSRACNLGHDNDDYDDDDDDDAGEDDDEDDDHDDDADVKCMHGACVHACMIDRLMDGYIGR